MHRLCGLYLDPAECYRLLKPASWPVQYWHRKEEDKAHFSGMKFRHQLTLTPLALTFGATPVLCSSALQRVEFRETTDVHSQRMSWTLYCLPMRPCLLASKAACQGAGSSGSYHKLLDRSCSRCLCSASSSSSKQSTWERDLTEVLREPQVNNCFSTYARGRSRLCLTFTSLASPR